MAQIPGVPTLQPVDKPFESPQQAGRVGAAVAGMGEDIEGIGETGLELQNFMKKAQEQVDTIAFQNKADAIITKMHDQLAKTTNSRNVDDVKTQTQNDLNELSKDWSKSPAAVRLQMFADSLRPSIDHFATVRQADLQVKEFSAETSIQLQKLLPQLVTAYRQGDTAQTQAINDHILGMFDEATRNGLMSVADRDTAVNKVQLEFRQGVNEAAITSLNPAERKEAIAQLKNGGKGPLDLTNLAPGDINALREHAIDTDKHLTEQAESQNLNGALNIAANAFSAKEFKNADGTPNFDSIETALHDGEWIKSHGMVDENGNPDRVMADKVASQYEVQRSYHVQAMADRDKKQWDSLEPRLYDPQKPLTENEIHQRALLPSDNPDWISRSTESHLLTASRQLTRENNARNLQERMMMRQEAEFESAQTLRELANTPGYLQNESELYQGEYSKLSKADRATAWAMKNINGAKEIQDAYRMMNTAVDVYPNTPDGNAKLAADKETLRQTVDAHKLMGKQIIDEAQGMLNPKQQEKKKSTVKSWLDDFWNFGERVETGEQNLVRRVVGKPPVIPDYQRPQIINERSANPSGIAPPKVGDVVNGFKFKGGDPADPKSWEK